MRTTLMLLCAVACSGCPPQPIPTPVTDAATKQDIMHVPPNEYGIDNCPAGTTVLYTDICDGMFTSDGLACAHCGGSEGCFDLVDVLYCAKGRAGCLDDEACFNVKDGAAGAPGTRKPQHQIKKVTPKLKRPV